VNAAKLVNKGLKYVAVRQDISATLPPMPHDSFGMASDAGELARPTSAS
jgi:hypothetical protein